MNKSKFENMCIIQIIQSIKIINRLSIIQSPIKQYSGIKRNQLLLRQRQGQKFQPIVTSLPKFKMKVQLSKDQLFQVKDSPMRKFKEQQIQRKRNLRLKRMNPTTQKRESFVQIVDPLPVQLKQYKQQTTYKKSVETSKASENLKKYIIQQERNLRCLRLQRLNRRERNRSTVHPPNSNLNSPLEQGNNQSSIYGGNSNPTISSNVQSSRQIHMHSLEKDDEKHAKQINIPKIEQVFKNQNLQYMLFQSKLLKQRIGKISTNIEKNVIKSPKFSIKENYIQALNHMTNNQSDSRQKTKANRMYHSVNVQQKKNSNDPLAGVAQLILAHHQSEHQHTNRVENHRYQKPNNHLKERTFQQMQIDQVIQKRLIMSEKLRKKMDFQKRNILSSVHSQDREAFADTNDPSPEEMNDISFILPFIMKQKKREQLKGVKSYSWKQDDRIIKLTPASHLLFQLHRLSTSKDKKESQLTGLLKNSFQNRENILNQKASFYQNQTQFNDLSPSHQFRLRRLMNKKLSHRLQLSKQQINNFIEYIYQIKNQYHVILNDTILTILKQVRLKLLKGKVMRQADLNQILVGKSQQDLDGYPGEKIVGRLTEMMI